MATLRSPRFIRKITAGEILPKQAIFLDFEANSPTKEQAPFNTVLIQNLSSQLIRAEYGDMDVYVGTGKTWCDPEAFGLRNITIHNESSTLPNDSIINIIVYRVVDSDAATVSAVTRQNLFDVANGVV